MCVNHASTENKNQIEYFFEFEVVSRHSNKLRALYICIYVCIYTYSVGGCGRCSLRLIHFLFENTDSVIKQWQTNDKISIAWHQHEQTYVQTHSLTHTD